ncbi:MAG: hypothetical protein EZS28_008081 [Streblomastix strix]|uniref:Uncharacterized protein n=1 Tax=Streblomastix strix TaxID=222440 RepID=A0A5J4WNK4_9EUKA|nr:MAG: hypothetical protein EZS28_008081 [Streblomastix strix]
MKTSSIPNLISSICKLCKFNFEILISDKEVLIIQDIRNHSIRSLGWIQCHGDNDAQSQLYKLGYAGMMAVAVGICGGYIANNNGDIKLALSSIGCFFSRIHEGRQIYREDIDEDISFPPQPELTKPSEEQFEEEGGNEEIEALLIDKGRNEFDDESINVRSIKAKYSILNHFSKKQNIYQKQYECQYDEDRKISFRKQWKY